MVWRWVCLALLVAAAAAAGEAAKEGAKERFDNFHVYRVVPTTLEQLQVLREIRKLGDGVSFWKPPALNKSVDVMVSEALREDVLRRTNAGGMDAALYIDNVQKLIDEENPLVPSARFDWNAYHPFAHIDEWLVSLSAEYQDKVEIGEIGTSPQGNSIRYVKISNRDPMNKAVFVEAGMNGNEWITIAVATYLVDALLKEDKKSTIDIDIFDWYIVPIVNPDGYEYSRVYSRLWKKNRPSLPGANPECIGVNLNHNFEMYIKDGEEEESDVQSKDKCDDDYSGEEAFSEEETKKLKEFLEKTNKLLVYFSLHSYGQVLSVPYGVDEKYIDDYSKHEDIMKGAVDELRKVANTTYKYGTTYAATNKISFGSSLDWVKDELETKYTFQWLLRDEGRRGFLLPANEIVSTAKETIESMTYILHRVAEEEGLPHTPTPIISTTDSTSTVTTTTGDDE